MKKITRKNCFTVLAFAAALVMTLMALNVSGEEKAKKLDGKTLFEQKCFKCHKPQKFQDQHNSRKDWDLILSRMQRSTCTLSDEERDLIAGYLEKEHGE